VLARFLEVFAIERTIQCHLAFPAAAYRADLTANGGTEAASTPNFAYLAGHLYNFSMVRTHLFFKVEVEHDEEERPEKIGEEIGRQLRKLYVVRSVELSSVVTE
jgi:hypothetical protein